MGKTKAKPKPLNKAQVFFIEQHGWLSVEELAAQLEVTPGLVQEVLDRLPEGDKKQKPKPPTKLANFETQKGVVSMTGQQSIEDDEKTKSEPARNKEFFKEHEKNIHKIRPEEPYN